MSRIPRRLLVAVLAAAGLFALTHYGTPEPSATTQPTPSPSIPVGPGADGKAQAALFKALEAERVYYVDNIHFAAGTGDELEELRTIEPGIEWASEVVVVVPTAAGLESLVTVLRATSSTGRAFCVAEVATETDAGTWYASRPVSVPCPKALRGMPGWLRDPAVGWA